MAEGPGMAGDTPEGPVFGGRYSLGEVLGRGGMAEVRAGRDLRLGREVAVKILRVDLARDPAFLHRFRREAQSAAALNHPAIVAVYDTGEEDGIPYIVMEYVAGRTLRDVLVTEGKPAPREALRITSVICDALDYSHRQGIVHRDIKPGNVMLTRTGAVKVMDFGIARAVASSASTMTQTAAVIGTAQYLSPEQARGEHVDARSDIYSVGCLLYELLTGTPPFTGESAVSVAYQHVRETPVPPSAVDSTVSADAEAVVLAAMAKDPAQRYQTAAEMKADIDRLLAGLPVTAAIPAGPATAVLPPLADETATMLVPLTDEPPGPPPRHRTRAWVLLGLACVLIAALAALLVHFLAGSGPVTVPNLHGDTVAKARSQLHAVGLKLGTQTSVRSTETKGTVVDQSPRAGRSVASGSAVAVTVSAGVRQVNVPNVIGSSLASAEGQLVAQGLKYKVVAHRNSRQPADTVLDQNPEQGTTLGAGSTVALTVATGRNNVPDVVGQQSAAAQHAVEAAGFSVVVIPDYNSSRPPGTVDHTSPAAHAGYDVGQPVTIYVSTRKLVTVSPSLSISPSPPPTTSTPSANPSSAPPSTPPPTSKAP